MRVLKAAPRCRERESLPICHGRFNAGLDSTGVGTSVTLVARARVLRRMLRLPGRELGSVRCLVPRTPVQQAAAHRGLG